MKTTQKLITISFLSMLLAYASKSWPGPVLNLDALTGESSLIVVGQVKWVSDLGRTTVEVGNRSVTAREMVAELRVDRTLKGTTDALSPLKIHFTQPDEFVGWVPVEALTYRVFFLRESSGVLQPVSPYYPSLVAVAEAETKEETAIGRVIDELSAVVESAKATAQQRREAVQALDSTKSSTAIRALKRLSEVKDLTLRLSVAAALLEHNDISVLQFAENTLLRSDPTIPSELLHNLSYGIFTGVKDEQAVPSLTRLLRGTDPETRRAAASALMHVGSTSCIEPLLSALNDPDRDVRYYSVVGLAEITGQTDWRPNMQDFMSDQRRYIEHWREWSQSR